MLRFYNLIFKIASIKLGVAALFIQILVACGGGGSSNSGVVDIQVGNNNPIEGSLQNPFPEELLKASNNFSPNGFVKSTASGRVYDFRQGLLSQSFVLSNVDDVQISVRTTSQLNTIISPYGMQNITYSYQRENSGSVYLGQSSLAFQYEWVTKNVTDSWAKGINGSGVRIAVLDDFTVDEISDLQLGLFDSDCYDVPYSQINLYFCPSISLLSYELTHGKQVSDIISGSESNYDGAVVYYGPYKINPFSYNENGVLTQYQRINISSSSPRYGIAFGAGTTTSREDYITHQKNTNGIFDQFKKWTSGNDFVSNNFKKSQVVNLSLGGTSSNPVANKNTYTNQLIFANSTEGIPDALFIKAAGNNSCNISSTNCDPINAVLYNSPSYKNKTLIVGALSNGLIASYSNKAGNYSNRFLVADGRGVQTSDGSYVEGTSFAAPRVSGYAALIRQKYPNLKAEDVADILLNTASWDSRWGLKNATTQAVYGQGIVNLERALNPIGMLP